MPYTAPTVNYATTLEGTYTTLTGVQSVNIARGRQYFQDNFPASSCVIELIPATSYATPLAIGQYLDVRDANTSNSPCYFSGRITDVQRVYGMPYNSGTGYAPADRIVVTASGTTGQLGQVQVNLNELSQDVSVAMQTITFAALSLRLGFIGTNVNTSAFTAESSALDAMNTVLRTGQYVMDDWDMNRLGLTSPKIFNAVFVYQIGRNFSQNYAFGDTGTGQRFKSIEYLSSAQTTFDKVQVRPTAYPEQTVSGTNNLNTLVYDTYSNSTADALSLANYLYSLLSGQLTAVPHRISTDTTVAANCMDLVKLADSTDSFCAIGQEASMTFRGSTVRGIIQGFNATFDVEKASLVVYMSPSLGQPFTLDSTTFGVLDTNRLGYP
jgi:hypothetical protein